MKFFRDIKVICVAVIMLYVLNGCAKTQIIMTSHPRNVEVTINNRIIRSTPFIVSYSNAMSIAVPFYARKEGYETVVGVVSGKGDTFHIDMEKSNITTSDALININAYMESELHALIDADTAITIVIVHSEPSDAEVTINGKLIRYTPFIASYINGRYRNVSFIAKKKGYKTIKGVIPPEGGRFTINFKDSITNIYNLL